MPIGHVQLFALATAARRYLERSATHDVVLVVLCTVRSASPRSSCRWYQRGSDRGADVLDLAMHNVETVVDLPGQRHGPPGRERDGRRALAMELLKVRLVEESSEAED